MQLDAQLPRLQFHDSHIIVILLVLFAICFCKQLLETTNWTLTIVERFVEKCACCGCVYPELARRGLIVYCFLLPVTYQMIFFGLQTWSKADWASSIIMTDPHLNSSTVAYASSLPQPPAAPRLLGLERTSWYVEVDYMFCVMPFALAASLSCWVWVCLSSNADRFSQVLDKDTMWDMEVPTHLLAYEVAYYVETFALNFSMVAIGSSGRTFVEIVFASVSLSFVTCIFLSAARHTHTDNGVQQATLTALFLLLAVILVLIWGVMLQRTCVVAKYAAPVHALLLFVLVGFHFAASGTALASTVILVRTMVTVVASVLHIAILLVGRNQACRGA
jgi:hypothetical protein